MAERSNDLYYIARDQSEMNFQPFSVGTRLYTAAEQAAAWDAYISQDSYLSEHRGEYAQRGAIFLPMVHRLDFSVNQDFFVVDQGPSAHVPDPRRLAQLRQPAQRATGASVSA